MPWAVAGTCTGASWEERWLLPESQSRFLWPWLSHANLRRDYIPGPRQDYHDQSVLPLPPKLRTDYRSGRGGEEGAGAIGVHVVCGRNGVHGGRGSVAFALSTGGPFCFSITGFPWLTRAPVPGLPLPGRHGRGQVLPVDLWVRGDVSSQPCPSPGCTSLHSGVC